MGSGVGLRAVRAAFRREQSASSFAFGRLRWFSVSASVSRCDLLWPVPCAPFCVASVWELCVDGSLFILGKSGAAARRTLDVKVLRIEYTIQN
jgi:hypothetical protein